MNKEELIQRIEQITDRKQLSFFVDGEPARDRFNHDESEYDSWNFDDETATIALEEKKWTYDYILPPDTTQEEMYNKVAIKTINDFTEGYHGTIFAYGQSGSGKTFSMIGPDSVFECLTNANTKNDLYGITPRAVYQIYDQLKEFSRNGSNWKLCLSYIEIYNEKVKCLLSGKEGLKIREVPHEGFIIQDKDILDCISKEIDSNKPLYLIPLHDKNPNWQNTYRLDIINKHISDVLVDKGVVQNKSLILKPPTCIMNGFIRDFIRGYFDGDGHIDKYFINIASTKEMCEWMKVIIKDELSVDASIYDICNKKDNNTKILSIIGKSKMLKFLSYLYDDADLMITRKYIKYQELHNSFAI